MTKQESKKDMSRFEVTKKLTPEAIEKHRARLGAKFNTLGMMRGPNQWVHFDRIIHWAQGGLGDMNPLYCDEAYANNSIYGTPTPPPSFIITIWRGMVLQGLPGVHAMMGGNNYEFLLPLLEGDKITADCTFSELEEKSGKFQDQWFIEHYDSNFFNQEGLVVAKQRSHVLRHDRAEADESYERSHGYSKAEFPHPWTEEEVRAIEEEQLDKKVQGATPLFFEDVNEGNMLPDLVRGPFSITDSCAQIGAHNISMSGPWGIWFHARKHKGYAYFHPMSRAHEHMDIIHWDKTISDSAGYPHPYDYGHHRQSWEMNAVTDWMGDEGWLKKNWAEYRALVVLGDVVRVKSKITRKYIDDDGEPCVDIEHNMFNQREQNVQPGGSTVALPSRERNYWPVRSRLARRGRLPKLPQSTLGV